MAPKKMEDVFKVSGVPTYTFVHPSAYHRLLVALRSSGRGVVVEGPSGIGKSTAVQRGLEELGMARDVTKLSPRDPKDVDYIEILPELRDLGTVIIDDFHKLPPKTRDRLADLLKRLADTESPNSKLIVIGINEAGTSLIKFAPDLANRIDRIRFEVEPASKIAEMISLGEKALNVTFAARDHVIDGAQGSFYLGQMLCREMCLQAKIVEEPPERVVLDTLYAAARRAVLERQEDRFGEAVRDFVRGPRFRPGGRAPYLHILKWLADAESWSISLKDEMARHPSERPSVSVVIDQGYLKVSAAREDIAKIVHWDQDTKTLTVEDPHLVFYLRNLDWPAFIKKVGFTRVDYDQAYDVALSFAGEDREFARLIGDHLEELGHAVFYDEAEQHRIIANNVEEYLGPIYASGSRYVVAILGERYGVKRWTLFEADKYKDRIEKGQVIPVWSKAVPASAFDKTRDIGGLAFDPVGDLAGQAKNVAEVISKKLAE